MFYSWRSLVADTLLLEYSAPLRQEMLMLRRVRKCCPAKDFSQLRNNVHFVNKIENKITSFTVDHKRPFPFLPLKWMPFVFFRGIVSQETSSKGSSHRAFCLKRSILTYPESILVFWELLRIQFHHCRTFLWINIYFVNYCTCIYIHLSTCFWTINNNSSTLWTS